MLSDKKRRDKDKKRREIVPVFRVLTPFARGENNIKTLLKTKQLRLFSEN